MGWNPRTLWRNCEELVDRLPLLDPFSPRRLLTFLGEERGVRTVFTPMEVQGRTPCGMLVLTSELLLVFYSANAPPLHQANTLLHEAGHLIRDDLSTESGKLVERVMALTPSLRPELIQRVLGRSGYHDEAEAGAELIAALIAERAGHRLSYDSIPGQRMGGPAASASAVFGRHGSWEL